MGRQSTPAVLHVPASCSSTPTVETFNQSLEDELAQKKNFMDLVFKYYAFS